MARKHGIFCLEGDWWNNFNRTSTVKPILKLLSQGGQAAVPFIHRDVATLEELEHYLAKWAQRKLSRFPILYLAFHGNPGCIVVGDLRRAGAYVTLDELASRLGGGLAGRVVHFGSCATLKADHRNIQRFLRSTGAVAVTGFKESVDWIYSAAFEVLLLTSLVDRSMTRAGARAVKREMHAEHGAMCRRLDFRMVVRE